MLGIVKKVFNIYYEIQTDQGAVLCKPRGRLRSSSKIFVGDRVEFSLSEDGSGVIESVQSRGSLLSRPPVANVQQVILVASLHNPKIDLDFVDRVALLSLHNGLQVVLVLNKIDALEDGEAEALRIAQAYGNTGFPVIAASAVRGWGIDEIRGFLKGKISVMAGRSGVGKSSLLNAIKPGLSLKTGTVSAKHGHGRHTTRHVELLDVDGGWVADAPGFSRVDLTVIPSSDLPGLMPEFRLHAEGCRFRGCLHAGEPGCAVALAAQKGEIDPGRFDRYRAYLQEIRQAETTRW